MHLFRQLFREMLHFNSSNFLICFLILADEDRTFVVILNMIGISGDHASFEELMHKSPEIHEVNKKRDHS